MYHDELVKSPINDKILEFDLEDMVEVEIQKMQLQNIYEILEKE